jgi:uncharacterized membrane protein
MMGKSRLEAFSDGVLAIIITIMVLELKVPHGFDWSELVKLWPVVLSYLLSFVFVGIYWVNHHHLIHMVKVVNAEVMWANLHLLFWLSLIPFFTGWMGENHFAQNPVAMYGAALFMCGIAFNLLTLSIRRANHVNHLFGEVKKRWDKGSLSLAMYALSVALAFWMPNASMAIFVTVAAMWVIPDKRVEQALKKP